MEHTYTVALAGNPNVGKSTVFNRLTGLRQHTGNWPGKTVERAEGYFSQAGQRFRLVDLPGTYSLAADSPEEEVAGALCERIRPHRNRGSLKNRYRVLAPQFQSVLALEDAAGLRTQEEKKTLAGRWLDLAAAFAGVPIQYEAEQMKQREAQSTLNMELGVTL